MRLSIKGLFFLLVWVSLPLFPKPSLAAPPSRMADHVFILIMENKGEGEIVHGADAPYFNGLSGGRLTNYWSLAHPSLPNYVGMMGAWPPLPESDDPRIRISGDSLPEEMVSHGHSVGSYMQGLPRPGFGGSRAPRLFGRYVLKHDPFLLFSRLRRGPVRKTVRPLQKLRDDLVQGRVPELSLIVPDLCHDMHGAFACHFHNRHELVKAGDRFLAKWIPVLEGSRLFGKAMSGLLSCGMNRDSWGMKREILILYPRKKGSMPAAMSPSCGSTRRIQGPGNPHASPTTIRFWKA